MITRETSKTLLACFQLLRNITRQQWSYQLPNCHFHSLDHIAEFPTLFRSTVQPSLSFSQPFSTPIKEEGIEVIDDDGDNNEKDDCGRGRKRRAKMNRTDQADRPIWLLATDVQKCYDSIDQVYSSK